jgi:hypothetical protein
MLFPDRRRLLIFVILQSGGQQKTHAAALEIEIMNKLKPILSSFLFLSGFFLLLAISPLWTSFNAYGYDLFGSDIDPAGLIVGNADQCAAACNSNANCAAWTFVKAWGKCFLKKNPVPTPSFTTNCPSNNECVSGLKRSDGWCGESPRQTFPGSGAYGQGQVLTCPAGQTCGPKISGGGFQVCWALFIPYPCHGEKIQTTDWFCLPGP